ncbi:MAG: acyl-CoA synthetase [Alphaproteobacteria bacterium]
MTFLKKYKPSGTAHDPTVFYALPELHYPQSLNATRALLDSARSFGPARPVFFHNGKPITASDVQREVRLYAHAIRRGGIAEGDHVLLRLDDGPELVFAILAVIAIGAVVVPTYTQLRAADLIYRVNDAAITAVIVASDLIDEIRPVVEACPSLRQLICTQRDSHAQFQALCDLLPSDESDIEFATTEKDRVALILYTSGSSGKPKGTLHSHADLLAICDSFFRYCLSPAPGDVLASPAAIPFALGFGAFVLYPLRLGATAVLLADKSAEALLDAASAHDVSIIFGVSTYYNRLSRVLRERGTKLPALRKCICAGEPLPERIETAWQQASGLPLEQVLGTTELLHAFIGLREGIDRPRRGAIGRAIPGYEVTLRDPASFREVAPGENGILCARGPTGTQYLNNPNAQAGAVRDGWSIFQDLCFADHDGYIHHVGRADEMIVSAGHSISPVEVEQVLLEHPAVCECACIAAPDPIGERPHIVKAFVVLVPEAAPSEALKLDLQAYFKRSAAPYKYPREIEFVPQLPKTINGKILRAHLRALSMRA